MCRLGMGRERSLVYFSSNYGSGCVSIRSGARSTFDDLHDNHQSSYLHSSERCPLSGVVY